MRINISLVGQSVARRFHPCNDKDSKLLPATFLPNALKIGSVEVNTTILHVFREVTRNSPSAKANESKIFIYGAKNASDLAVNTTCQFPYDKAQYPLSVKTPFFESGSIFRKNEAFQLAVLPLSKFV